MPSHLNSPSCGQVQFYMILAHTLNVIYYTNTGQCDFPAWMGFGWLFYVVSMITLFSAFYLRAYIKGERLGAAKRAQQPIIAPPLGGPNKAF